MVSLLRADSTATPHVKFTATHASDERPQLRLCRWSGVPCPLALTATSSTAPFSISRPSAKLSWAAVGNEWSSSFPGTPFGRLQIHFSNVGLLRRFGRRPPAKRSQHWAYRRSGEVRNPLIRQQLRKLALHAPQAGCSRTTDNMLRFPAYPPGLWRSPTVRSLY